MGKRPRMRQERLAEKLLQIRNAFGLSQTEMLWRLGFEKVIDYKRISEYELGKNEPPLAVLLQYARLAGISTDVLIDDKLDLPTKLPVKAKRPRR
jgi:transcriptional regulator with XRE-family HTH domain